MECYVSGVSLRTSVRPGPSIRVSVAYTCVLGCLLCVCPSACVCYPTSLTRLGVHLCTHVLRKGTNMYLYCVSLRERRIYECLSSCCVASWFSLYGPLNWHPSLSVRTGLYMSDRRNTRSSCTHIRPPPSEKKRWRKKRTVEGKERGKGSRGR